jgi:predicted  nucleic acid-binding Zn-ribbon protein
MTLNEFISRAVSYFDKAESTEQKETARLAGRVSELEASLVTANGLVAQRDETIKGLQAQLEPQAVKITSLEKALADEKARVTETLAGLGVKPEGIPAADKDKAAEPSKASILEQYKAITDPAERVAFYRANQAAMDAAWK